MKVHIFNVEHGNCIAVELPSSELIMIDCGHNSTTGWRPSKWVKDQGGVLLNLTVTNFDVLFIIPPACNQGPLRF